MESLFEITVHLSVSQKAAASSSVRSLAITEHQVTKNHQSFLLPVPFQHGMTP